MLSAFGVFNASILIIDDKEANVLLLERMLRGAGYAAITSTMDPHVVADMKEIEQDGYLPVMVITAQPQHKLHALQFGAKNFISKPLELPEVLMRTSLEIRLLLPENTIAQ